MIEKIRIQHAALAIVLIAGSAARADEQTPSTAASLGIAFVRIEPGAFVMGSPSGEPGRESWEAQRTVVIPRPFWLAAHEVTQSQWLAVMGANPSHFREGAGNRPVENVTWHEVQEFLRRLSASELGSSYRLPTEAEWEYACRAGSTTAYSGGSTLTTAHANIASSIEESIAGRGGTRAVGSYGPNAWGLFDMSGNVWEWTADDAPPPASGVKIIRGGSWYYEADSARCALRYTHRPQDRGFSLGFRVAHD